MFSTTSDRFDIVIYGASGFTGQYVLESFVKSEEYDRMTIAVAGRSEQKLQQTLRHVGQLTGISLTCEMKAALMFICQAKI
jgi:short subunit dehydrogenase-like uncharacterized protein